MNKRPTPQLPTLAPGAGAGVTNYQLQFLVLLVALAFLASACLPAAQVPPRLPDMVATTPGPSSSQGELPAAGTPLPTREPFAVGQIFTYTTQTGDTLVALAAHFNTSQDEILARNPGLATTSTLASGISLVMPVYWFPLGGSPYKIIPDSEFVYGPSSKGFDVEAYVASQPGYLRTMSAFVDGSQRTGGQTIQYVAESYSINPRLFLALMEWRSGALSQADVSDDVRANPFGPLPNATGFYT